MKSTSKKMKNVNRLLKVFYLTVAMNIIFQTSSYDSLHTAAEIPAGFGPLIVCGLSLAVISLRKQLRKAYVRA